uniref:Uncharacterized protein n=1 Tax=Arundo donax TaxID=35708 RepID=A0A0A9HUR0_ARUDO
MRCSKLYTTCMKNQLIIRLKQHDEGSYLHTKKIETN